VPDRDQEAQQLLAQFGERLRLLRDQVGLSQAELAHSAGLHPTYVSSVERGQRNVSLINIVTLAHALGLPPGELMSGLS
jgi:transcriptional regulator with XRE-family HTH domain